MRHTHDPYKLARRANLAAAERGEFQTAELPPRRIPEVSEVLEPPKGWRKLFIRVRRVGTTNAKMTQILPTVEEIQESQP